MQLVLLTDIGSSAPGASIPPWISAVQEPFLGYVHVFMVPNLPPLGGATNYSPEGGYQEIWTATVWLLCAPSNSNAPDCTLHPSLFCLRGTELMGEQTATLQWTPRWKPVSLLTVPSCELHFKKSLLCIVVTNMCSICWMYMNILSYFCSLKMSEVFFSFSFMLN